MFECAFLPGFADYSRLNSKQILRLTLIYLIIIVNVRRFRVPLRKKTVRSAFLDPDQLCFL